MTDMIVFEIEGVNDLIADHIEFMLEDFVEDDSLVEIERTEIFDVVRNYIGVYVGIMPLKTCEQLLDSVDIIDLLNNYVAENGENNLDDPGNFSRNLAYYLFVSVLCGKGGILEKALFKPIPVTTTKTDGECDICSEEHELFSLKCSHVMCGECCEKLAHTERVVCPFCRSALY